MRGVFYKRKFVRMYFIILLVIIYNVEKAYDKVIEKGASTNNLCLCLSTLFSGKNQSYKKITNKNFQKIYFIKFTK